MRKILETSEKLTKELFVLGPPDRVAEVAGLSRNPEEGDAS